MLSLINLKEEINMCSICSPYMDVSPNPIFQIDQSAKILITGQAPGSVANKTGIPFNDASGEKLRSWMGIDKPTFYSKDIAIIPMGFCYPGKAKSGDLPPRKECAIHWREKVLSHLNNIQCELVIGKYAHQYCFNDANKTLTSNVQAWKSYSPNIFPLPHPSPRNYIWFKNNPWFQEELLPALKTQINLILTK